MLSQERRIPRLLLNELERRPHKRFMGRILSLKVYTLSQNSRFSFRVAKKIAKTAVARNYLRRLGYSTVGKYEHDLTRGAAAIFSYLKVGKGNAFKSAVEADIDSLLKKSAIIL